MTPRIPPSLWPLLCLAGLVSHCGGSGDGSAKSTDRSPVDAGDRLDAGDDADAPETGGGLLVDDFEDGDNAALTGGVWYVYDDRDNDGASTISVTRDAEDGVVMDGVGYESERGMAIRYALDKGGYEWDPYVGWGVTMDTEGAPFDARSYSGVTYAYKGAAHSITLETYDVENWDWYHVKLKASSGWTVVELLFDHFTQELWDGVGVPLNLDNIKAIGFLVKGPTGEEGEVVIDNLAFLAEGAVARVPDLTIREPAPPTLVTLDDLEISNPAQARAMESLNKGYNLTNWLEQARFESYVYDQTTVENLAAAGFESLRLPIDLDLYIADREGYFSGEADFEIAPLLFEILDSFEAWTAAAGLSLTIDYHQYDSSFDMGNPRYTEAVVGLWSEVAAHFSDNPRTDLFFEIMNEPELAGGTNAVSQADWTDFAAEIIAAIRGEDDRHTIIFGDVGWNGIDPLLERTPFDDENIIYVFHFYEPFIFTHQGASWSGMASTGDIPYPYEAARWTEYSSDFGFLPSQEQWHFDQLRSYHRTGNKAWIQNRLSEIKAWAVENDVPVICNEFGVLNRSVQKQDLIRYYTDIIDIFETLEIPWQHWFMVMDAEGTVDPNISEALRL